MHPEEASRENEDRAVVDLAIHPFMRCLPACLPGRADHLRARVRTPAAVDLDLHDDDSAYSTLQSTWRAI